MSMELYVFSDHRLHSIRAWQRAIDAQGFPLQLSDQIPFAALQGALSVQLREKSTAFECDHWNASTMIAESPEINFDRHWKHALAFRWGSDAYAGAAAYLAGSAYAKATGGVLLDCEEGKIISAKRAAEIGFDIERSTPMIEAAVRKAIERFRNDLSKP
jgi:hypothetical protein